jgi:DNA-directed RNA polymerase specialized sigma24 family protein
MNHEQTTAGFFGVKTLWTTIMRVRDGDEATRIAALERLTTLYRSPMLRYVQAVQARWPEHWHQDPEDVTQEFIHKRLLANAYFTKVGPEHGRFRSYLKTCLRNFVHDKLKESLALKRGRGVPSISLASPDTEGCPSWDPAAPDLPPEILIDQEWALQVLDNAMSVLEQECTSSYKKALFKCLKTHSGQALTPGVANEIAATFDMKVGAVYTATNRMRARLGELIRDEVRQTVGTHDDWFEELKYLVQLLSQE